MTKEEMEKQIHGFAELMYKTGYEDGYKNGIADGNINDGTFAKKIEEAYENGLNDAWECARKVVFMPDEGGLTVEELDIIFGKRPCCANTILNEFTASEAVAKIKEYEDKHIDDEIKLWDEVIITKSSYGYAGCKGIVTNILRYDLVEVMINYGTVYNYDTETIQKTGKSYPELGNILDQSKGDNDQ